MALLAQAPTFAYLETNHFDVMPTGPARGVGDVDGDGDQDALFGSVLYRNDGKAFFTRDLELPDGIAGCMVDLDGDARSELVQIETGPGSISVAVYRRAAVGLQNVQTIGLPPVPLPLLFYRTLLHGDLDGDGDADLFASLGGSFLHLRNAAGILVHAPAPIPLPFSAPVLSTALADLDLDGRLDVVCSAKVFFTPWILWFRGGVGGGFLPAQTIHQPNDEIAVEEAALQVGDFDGDGDPDLAYTRAMLSTPHFRMAQVLRNDRPGWALVVNPPNGLVDAQAVGVSRRRQATPQLLVQARLFDGATVLGFASVLPNGLQWTYSEAYEQVGAPFAEVDLDGDLDVDWIGTGLLRLSRVVGAGQMLDAAVVNPRLGVSVVPRARLQFGREVLAPEVGRLRFDGALSRVPRWPNGFVAEDYAFWSYPSSQLGFHVAASADRLWLAPEGDPAWRDFPGLLHDVKSVAMLSEVRAVVACSDFPGGLAVLASPGQVDPALSLAIPAPRLASPDFHAILVADLEGDGHQDVIHDFRWLRNTATVTLQDAGDLVPAVPSGVRELATLDFDGDGDLDVYVARAGLDLLLELRNGVFVDVTIGRIPTENSDCGGVRVGDLDGDGDPDVLLFGMSSGLPTVPTVWLRNQGGVFTRLPFALDDAKLLADVDLDGDADVLTSTRWLRNTARQFHVPRLPTIGAPFVVDLHANGPANSLPWGLVAMGAPALPTTLPAIEGQLAIQPAGLAVIGVRPLQPGINTFATQLPNSALLFGSSLATQALWIEPNGRLRLSPAETREIW
ncbi:MAG: FG-GAP-like repeat-containing protein [Planctomycetes bacterium]|jgi:hypothetical protein|nr:FG-GAP-like repeat-containing protein [Planctomycetota bacterium]